MSKQYIPHAEREPKDWLSPQAIAEAEKVVLPSPCPVGIDNHAACLRCENPVCRAKKGEGVKLCKKPKWPDCVSRESYEQSRQETTALTAKLKASESAFKTFVAGIEESEAAHCPEDVGFVEYVETLEKKLKASEERVEAAELFIVGRKTSDFVKWEALKK